MLRAAALASALTLAAAVPAHAQTNAPFRPDSSHPGWADFMTFMRGARDLALTRFSDLECGDAPCAPATPQELATPPISDDDLLYVGTIAITSAMAEHCGLDWETRSFRPMMMEWRSRPGLGDRDYALVAAVHGVAQARVLQSWASDGPCDDQTRADLDAALPF